MAWNFVPTIWLKSGLKRDMMSLLLRQHFRIYGKNIEIKERKEEFIDGIRYIWLPTDKYVGNTLCRFKNMLQFVRQLYSNMSYFKVLLPML